MNSVYLTTGVKTESLCFPVTQRYSSEWTSNTKSCALCWCNSCRGRKCETEPQKFSLWRLVQHYCSTSKHKLPFKYNYDTTFTSLGEDVTGSSAVRSSLLASLVACLMASLYGPLFFLLYLVCKNDETQNYIMEWRGRLSVTRRIININSIKP
jgi:hypothetical protein